MICQACDKEFDTPPNFWEILITLSYIAAETTTLKLATAER